LASDFNTASDASGNEAASWNYGENFGGHATSVSAGSTFTPYATMHHAADATGGMFGQWAVDAPNNYVIPALDLHPCETMFAHADGRPLAGTLGDLDACKAAYDADNSYGSDVYVDTYNDLIATGVDHQEAHQGGFDAAVASLTS
jgi:hypothetical protein